MAPVYIPTDNAQESLSFHILTCTCWFLPFWWWPFWQVWGHTSLWVSFAFCWWLVMSRVMWLLTSLCLPWKNVYASAHFWRCCFNVDLCEFFHILLITHLLDMLSANILYHAVGCLFTLLIASFTVQKDFSLVWVSPICLFLLSFPLPKETCPKKYYKDLCQRTSCLCFF